MSSFNKTELFDLISQGKDFKFFLDNIFHFPAAGGVIGLPGLLADKDFDELFDVLEDPRIRLVYQDRYRASGGRLFVFAYSLYKSLYEDNINNNTIVFACNSKDDTVTNAKLFIEIINLINQEHGININYKIDDKISGSFYIDIEILGFNMRKPKIRFMHYNHSKPILMDAIMRINCSMLCPLGAPYVKGYRQIRDSLVPSLYNCLGKEVIISNGGSLRHEDVRYFYMHIRDMVIRDKDRGLYYIRKNVIDIKMDDANLKECFLMINGDIDIFAREYLCMYINEKEDSELVLSSLPDVIRELYIKRTSAISERRTRDGVYYE